jgi:hypothetical protein
MKKIFLPFAAIALMVSACNNTNQAPAQDNDTADSSAAHNHEHDSHEAANNLLPIPENANVYFANLQDGDTVSNPVIMEFGIEGMEVEPAGEAHEGKGHHHVIINGSFSEEGAVVPADSVNIHYGGGQTGDSLDLPLGTHTLTMQFADGYHRSYGEQMSQTITVTVVE